MAQGSVNCAGVLLLVVIIAHVDYVHSSMTEAQMASAGKLIRNVCQPKNKVTDAQVDDFHKGVFDNDRKMMCYMNCVLGMGKLLKSNRFDADAAIAAVGTIPKSLQAPTIASINNCRDSGVSDEKCEHAYQVATCMFTNDPQHYFLP